jgi:hypothetical protein
VSTLILLPAATAVLAGLLAVALLDQYRERRHAFQLIWAVGMAFFGIAAACEAIAAQSGWNEALYRTWYLTGAVLTAGWLGLGTIVLLTRTRFGYTMAAGFFLAGLLTLLTQAKFQYLDAGIAPIVYFGVAAVVAIAVAVETYFQSRRWAWIAAGAIVGASVVGLLLTIIAPLVQPFDVTKAIDHATGQPVADLLPGSLRLLTPLLNIAGGFFGLVLGALFSTYVFMPKRRVLAYSLDPGQSGDQFLFNLLIAPVAIVVNLLVSLPGAVRALVAGRLHSRVLATLLIAVGGLVASAGDSLNRFGITAPFAVAKLVAVILLLAGFLVSIEAFREIRVPFTSIRLTSRRVERADAAGVAAGGGDMPAA